MTLDNVEGKFTYYNVGKNRYALVDGLRGVAAFSVLCWHYQHFFKGADFSVPTGIELPLRQLFAPFYAKGYLGVEVFWVISGFVFSVVYCGSASTSRQFFANRFARLYPLHFLTLAVVAVLQTIALWKLGRWLIYDNNDLYHLGLQLLFIGGWGFERGYSFNGPIWSVSVEVLIYIAFWLVHRRLAGVWQPTLVALGFVALHKAAGGNIALCGIYFFLGCATAELFKLTESRTWMQASAVALLVLGAGVLNRLHSSYDVAGVAMALVLALASVEKWAPKALQGICGAVGDCSYGVYLWHIPVQLILLLTFGAAVPQLATHAWFMALFLFLTLVFAVGGFIVLERPARDWLRERLRTPHKRRAHPA